MPARAVSGSTASCAPIGTSEYNILGFVDSELHDTDGTGGDLLGGLEDLEQVLMRSAIDEVFIALPIKSRYTEIQQVM